MGVRSDIRWYPSPPHHRIRTNNIFFSKTRVLPLDIPAVFFSAPKNDFGFVFKRFYDFDDFMKTKKMRDVRTIILAAVSRRDLCDVSENEGLCVETKVFLCS